MVFLLLTLDISHTFLAFLLLTLNRLGTQSSDKSPALEIIIKTQNECVERLTSYSKDTRTASITSPGIFYLYSCIYSAYFPKVLIVVE